MQLDNLLRKLSSLQFDNHLQANAHQIQQPNDNSVENAEPKLLFRATDGKLEKNYSEVNIWAQSILKSLA